MKRSDLSALAALQVQSVVKEPLLESSLESVFVRAVVHEESVSGKRDMGLVRRRKAPVEKYAV